MWVLVPLPSCSLVTPPPPASGPQYLVSHGAAVGAELATMEGWRPGDRRAPSSPSGQRCDPLPPDPHPRQVDLEEHAHPGVLRLQTPCRRLSTVCVLSAACPWPVPPWARSSKGRLPGERGTGLRAAADVT